MATLTHRVRTRSLVIVHSHHSNEPIHISRDVLSLRTMKAIKAVGSMSLDLVPRRNYFNVLYPNDVINLYIDTGDGNGFIRVFMGYIDKVERTETTDPKDGTVTSAFRLVCSDFQKVFDRTEVHVNPNLQDRKNLVEKEYLVHGAETGLMTAGVRMHGSPADIVENLTSMLLGFGKQWVLPVGYGAESQVVMDNRRRRLHRSKARLGDKVFDGLAQLGLVPAASPFGVEGLDVSKLQSDFLKRQVPAVFTGASLTKFENASDLEEAINAANVPPGKNPDNIENLTVKVGEFQTVEGKLPAEVFAQLRAGKERLREYHTALRDVSSGTHSFIDLLDLSFIEASAIDGYIQDSALWQEGGSLISIMKKFSNEMMNEMIFDLRPVAMSGSKSSLDNSEFLDRCFGEEYWKGPDELGLNVEGVSGDDDFSSPYPAVAYVPAIVFREYPWSCVEGVDLGGLATLGANGSEFGFVPFGPVFSKKGASDSGEYRAIYDYRTVAEIGAGNMSLSALSCNYAGPPLKHLDVVTIHDQDVMDSTVGRSDNDVINFFSMYAEDAVGALYKHIMKEFMPITVPISIARNGLRAKEHTSRFASYDRDTLCGGDEEKKTTSGNTVKNMMRWLLLKDHWEQHNIEYLTGEITLRGMPSLRVGYRLDWESRKESYYVESVGHAWSYGKEMQTSVQVSRGQRNDPYPLYVPPTTENLTVATAGVVGGERGLDGRLAVSFDVVDTPATYRSTQAEGLSVLPEDDALANEKDSEVLWPANVVRADGTRDAAQDISSLLSAASRHSLGSGTLSFTPSLKGIAAGGGTSTERALPAPSPFTPKRASNNYDDVFEKWGPPRGIPVAFLRALSKRESGLNPNQVKGPAWGLMQIGIDGFPDDAYQPVRSSAPPGRSGKVLLSFTDRVRAGLTPPDVLDPSLNVEVCTELLQRVIRILESNGLGRFSFDNMEHVGLLVAGWNAGYSKKRGLVRMLTWLKDNGHDLTLSNMFDYSHEARLDIATQAYPDVPPGQLTEDQLGEGLVHYLSWPKKYNWWLGVVAQYRVEKDRG